MPEAFKMSSANGSATADEQARRVTTTVPTMLTLMTVSGEFDYVGVSSREASILAAASIGGRGSGVNAMRVGRGLRSTKHYSSYSESVAVISPFRLMIHGVSNATRPCDSH
jgi:hypothetical protein